MKKYFQFLLLSIVGNFVFVSQLLAQETTFLWANKTGGPEDNESLCMALDNKGNIYISGIYNDIAKLWGVKLVNTKPEKKPEYGGFDFTLPNKDIHDVFIAKLTPEGNPIWVQKAGGPQYDGISDLVIDKKNNVYITGYFQNSFTIGSTKVTGYGDSDGYVAKYDTNGKLQWLKHFGGPQGDNGFDLTLDKKGNVYVAGRFVKSVNFGQKELTSISSLSSLSSFFIAKYNDEGNLVWAQKVGGSGSFNIEIETDKADNLFVCGEFEEEASFGDVILTSQDSTNLFLAKFDTEGKVKWARKTGGVKLVKPEETEYGYEPNITSTNLVVDNQGNLLISGRFKNKVKFGLADFSGSPNWNLFFLKCDKNGKRHWATKGIGGEFNVITDMATDKKGNLYATGCYQDSLQIQNYKLNGANYNNACFFKFDESGKLIWAQIAGQNSQSSGNAIALTAENDVVVTGDFYGLIGFDKKVLKSAGQSDIFLVKIKNPDAEKEIKLK